MVRRPVKDIRPSNAIALAESFGIQQVLRNRTRNEHNNNPAISAKSSARLNKVYGNR
jgi:hypothetical protein